MTRKQAVAIIYFIKLSIKFFKPLSNSPSALEYTQMEEKFIEVMME
jgi:hypothetical protein